jgi:hypothetical protein
MTRPVRHDLTDPAIPEGMVRITRHSSHRFIWPVHLAGWQSMGWQLQPEAAASEPEQELGEPEQQPEPQPGEPEASDPQAELPTEATGKGEPEAEPDPDPEAPADDVAPEGAPSGLAPEGAPSGAEPTGTDFQAMTKAQIIEHCQSLYGVELDGSQTKAELVEQATALEAQTLDDLLL